MSSSTAESVDLDDDGVLLSAAEVRAAARVVRVPFDARSWRTLLDAQLARTASSERAKELFARFFARFPSAACE